MTNDPDKTAAQISAWLDGTLSAAERAALEAEALADPGLAAEMQAYQAQDAELAAAFDALLDAPLPDALSAAVAAPAQASPAPVPANLSRAPIRALLAASLAFLLIGGAGGAYVTRAYFPKAQIVEVSPGWMAQVASYHRIYARQARHLAEVPASEQDHIEAWLGKETGVDFTVPDLSQAGFTFEGARLLVAADKPVVQLLYRDASGRVVALCALASTREAEGFETRQFGADITIVRWAKPGADWVAVGDSGADLMAVAELASAAL